jgi:NTE family protein
MIPKNKNLKIKHGDTISLALGGGAARGVVHVGVLKALFEFDIKVQAIAGTSVGAFIGILYAKGLTPDEIFFIVRELRWRNITTFAPSARGLLKNTSIGKLLQKHAGNINLEDLPIPMFVIATDITTGEKVVFDQGSIVPAINATTCIPGIFVPVEHAGRVLVDGGVTENVPVSPLLIRNLRPVLAVNLGDFHTGDADSMFTILSNSYLITRKLLTDYQLEQVEHIISPHLQDYEASDDRHADELFEIGYESTMKYLTETESQGKYMRDLYKPKLF